MSNIRGRHRVHPQVELARQTYGVPGFNGHRSVATYEDALEKQMTVDGPNLSREDRLTCPDCRRFKVDHDWEACDREGKLF